MRRANRTLRHAKLQQQISSFRQLYTSRPHHGWVGGSARSIRQEYIRPPPSRKFATTVGAHLGHLELIASDDLLPTSWAPKSQEKEPSKTYIQEAESFGKWNRLAKDHKRLALETNFDPKGPDGKWRQHLLVDHVENYGDLMLWSCLLNYTHRVHGDSGVLRLWAALWGRKSLFVMKSLPAKNFWRTIVEAALRSSDDKFLDGIFIYAEWMREIHDTKWPDLYTTVISHFLRTHQHEKAVRWHLRLSPNFYPGSGDFVQIIQKYVTDSVLSSAFTLQSLYITSPERKLYDTLIPYLYARGQSRLARLWRGLCVQYDDVPLLHVPARPFLRHLVGYWPNNHLSLHPGEVRAIGGQDEVSPEAEKEQQLEVSREFVNRIHGQTFGFSAKTYNDRLGSRWFASSWVSLDTAISIIAALGIQEIGPLSLQSIALREGTPDGIMARISQLQGLGVSIPDSGYANTIQYLARIRDEGLLADILQCDLHPDIFDDIHMQNRLLESSASSRDWQMYTLLLASRLASMEKTTETAANTLLEMYIDHDDLRSALRILDDMRATQISIGAKYAKLMFGFILRRLKWHKSKVTAPRDLGFCLALGRRLSSMDIPVPAICWKKMLYCLGRHANTDEFNRLIIELVDYYTIRQSAQPGFMPVHLKDLPRSVVEPLLGVKKLIGIYIPLDTNPSMQMHPLRLIFGPKLQGALIRWAFRQIHSDLPRVALIDQSEAHTPETYFGRAIDMLRKVRETGINIDRLKVQKAVFIRLADLYGAAPPIKDIEYAGRRTNILTLGQMKVLCDKAWGDEDFAPLLPPLEELKKEVEKFDANRWKHHEQYVEHIKRQLDNPKKKWKVRSLEI
jgi:hypothetical protein